MTFPNDRYQVIGVFADGISYDEVFISSTENLGNVVHTCQGAKENRVTSKA